MSEEITSAFLRVLPFVFALTLLSIFIHKKRINRFEIGLTPPFSWATYLKWVVAFLILILAEELLTNKKKIPQVSLLDEFWLSYILDFKPKIIEMFPSPKRYSSPTTELNRITESTRVRRNRR